MGAPKFLVLAVAAPTALALAGCGSNQAASSPAPTVTVTATATRTATVTATPTVTEQPAAVETSKPPKPHKPRGPFPRGYPKKVAVSTLPDQVRSWYQMDHAQWAVAVAPGVWAELPPGANLRDAATAGVLDGFCGSIKAYERQYTPGEGHGGSCW
jgi:hypothetical protein